MIAKLTSDRDQVQIVIAAKRRTFYTVFICLWLSFWSFGCLLALADTLRPNQSVSSRTFHALFLLFFLLSEFLVLRRLSYRLAGKEEIQLTSNKLRLTSRPFGVPSVQEFDRSRIENWQVAPRQYFVNDFTLPNRFGFRNRGAISFSYGPRTIRFGKKIDHQDALLIFKTLSDHPATDPTS